MPVVIPIGRKGRTFGAPVRGLLDFTSSADPSAVVSAVAQEGGYLACTMANNAVASGTPVLGRSWWAPLKGLDGVPKDSDIGDLLSAVEVWAGDNDPTTADVRIMAGFVDQAVPTATFGFGVSLSASGTDWQVGHLVFPLAGAWTLVAGGAANANVRGARALARNTNTTTQRNVGAIGLGADSLEITGAPSSAPANSAVGDNLGFFFLAIGWVAGAGGTNGAVVKLAGCELLAKLADFAGTARP